MTHFIEMYMDALSRDVCDEIIDRFEKDPRKGVSRTMVRVNPKVRTGTMLLPGELPDWRDVVEQVETVIRTHLAAYVEKYQSLRNLTRPERSILTAPIIERIEPGQGYDYHIDAGPANTYDRFLSTIIYLKNVDEGGYTEFPYQSFRTVPRAGAILIFPPFWTHMHRGATPISGTKYNITNFMLVRPQRVQPAVTTGSAATGGPVTGGG